MGDETCSLRSHLLSASRVKFSASKKTKPEQREHEVLHRQQRDRLSSLGSGSWGGNSVLCQPGVEPLQRRQPRWYQRRELGNNNPVGNGLLGFLGGFGAAAVTHSVLGNPCG